ncbi:MAG TPA: hypothetical protein QF604_11105 [Candidatus Latescibacteria bacterium]|nr:hypothetical protein [Candidatus Latescibacterota bacterium]MED5413622.1 hypothetical protein [Candidatus Latescibacterota bacterium]MEE3264991.1 hypothetical protein [Candidatus Latescibacterota bacterium]HJN28454.1 hypothetical protein [Candidatus Latescibacterota bacterium]
MQHLCRRQAEQFDEAAIVCLGGWILDVFDDVELDVAVAQNLLRSPRLASIGVVVDGHIGHVEAPFLYERGETSMVAKKPGSRVLSTA